MSWRFIQTIFFSLIFFLFVFNQASATPSAEPPVVGLGGQITGQLNTAGAQTGLTSQDPRATVAKIIRWSLGLLAVLFLAYIVYAGFLWMTAGGDEKKVEESKSHLKNGVIGLIIILSALSITLLVTTYIIRGTNIDLNPYQPPLPYEPIR